MPELDTDKPIDDMTNSELRAKIASEAAHRPPKAGLRKETLNSLHAWFTGEFHTDRRHMKPGDPSKVELLKAVVREAIEVYDDHPLDPDDGDLDDHPVPELVVYYRYLQDLDDGESPEPMRRPQLVDFRNAMWSSGDQRTWSIHNTEGDT